MTKITLKPVNENDAMLRDLGAADEPEVVEGGGPEISEESDGEPSAAPKPQRDGDDQGGDGEDGAGGDGRGDITVALQKERQQHREARQAARRYQEQIDAERRTFQAVLDRLANAQGAAPGQVATRQGAEEDDPFAVLEKPVPRWEDDPDANAAAIEAQRRAILKINAERRERQEVATQSFQANRQEQAIVQLGAQHVQDFAIEYPDYSQAEQHVLRARKGGYEAMGLNGQEVAQAIHEDMRNVILRAHRTGGNAAEMVYRMALAGGYRPGAAGQGPGGGEPSAERMIAEKAMKSSGIKSLGTAGGSSRSGRMTAESVVKMSDKEIYEMDASDLARALGLA